METLKIDGSISNIMKDDEPAEYEGEQEDSTPDYDFDDLPIPDKPTKPAFSVLNYNEEDRAHRRQTIKKIRLYMANFRGLLPIDIENLEMNEPNEKLDYVIQDIEFQLATKKSFEVPLMAYRLGLMGLENATCKMGMKTKGLATICTSDEDILNTAKELFIKYDASKEICAEYRLAFSISMVMFSLHTQNKQKEQVENIEKLAKNDDIAPEIINKNDDFNDL